MFTMGMPLRIGGDPDFRSVVLLAHMNGANGSTTFADSSLSAHTLTASGNAQTSTAASVFNGSSGLFDGTGDWVQTTTGLSDFTFGTADFTVECWAKTSATRPALVDFYSSTNAGSWQLVIGFSSFSHLEWVIGTAGAALTLLSGATAISNGNWNHLAISRVAGVSRLFVNGVVDAAVADSTNYNYSTSPLAIGAQVSSRNALYDMNGNIAEVRITKGVGRYSGNFTVPTAPFQNS